jgi:GAF domain-containing protein
LSTAPDLNVALGRILDLAIEATGADFGNIQLRAVDGSLRIAAQRGFERPFLEFFRVVKHDKSACSAVLWRRRRVVVRDVRRSHQYTEPARRVMIDAGVLACQSTPILSPDREVSGVVSTHFRSPHAPNRGELAVVAVLAKQAGLLIKGSEASQQRLAMARAFSDLCDTFAPRSRVIRKTRAKQ